jgi:hypothetical protein
MVSYELPGKLFLSFGDTLMEVYDVQSMNALFTSSDIFERHFVQVVERGWDERRIDFIWVLTQVRTTSWKHEEE